MNKFVLAGGLAIVLAGSAVVTLETAGRTTGASPAASSQRFSCLGMSGNVTTEGVSPNVQCLTGDGSGQLKITTQATPAATAIPKSQSTTVRSSGGNTYVDINGSSTTQTSSSSSVIIEQNSQSTSSQGHSSNTSRSTTNINITNH